MLISKTHKSNFINYKNKINLFENVHKKFIFIILFLFLTSFYLISKTTNIFTESKLFLNKILINSEKSLLNDNNDKPHVILLIGVNGSGKTTTAGKIASMLKEKNKKVVIAACDTFRAAAVEQLEQWASRTKSLFFKGSNSSDAASVAFKALEFSIKEKADYLIVDTAGRLQNKTGLMDELSKICRVISKLNANAPHNKIVVLDGTVGQNAHSQVKNFNEQIQLTGMIITKLDGSAKGGVIVSLAEQFKLPIFAVGVGEKVDDLDIFKANDYSKALLNLE